MDTLGSMLCRHRARSIAFFTSAVLLTTAAPVLAACGSGDNRAARGARKAAPQGTLVQYKRSGGLAGGTVMVTVRSTGKVIVRPDGHPFKLSRHKLTSLKRAIKRADLPHLPADNRPRQPVSDDYEYWVTANGRTVYSQGAAVPSRLLPLLNRFNSFLTRGRGY
jgi:hypothetical protein